MGTMIQYGNSGRASAPPDRARAELSAMQTIADILSSLPDIDARQRVLRWVAEHFDEAPATAIPAPVRAKSGLSLAPLAPQADPENLDSLFENENTSILSADKPVCHSGPQPVASMIESFVDDFRKLANDWQSV